MCLVDRMTVGFPGYAVTLMSFMRFYRVYSCVRPACSPAALEASWLLGQVTLMSDTMVV